MPGHLASPGIFTLLSKSRTMNKLFGALNVLVALAVLLYYGLEAFVSDMDLWGILSWCMLVMGIVTTYLMLSSGSENGGGKVQGLMVMMMLLLVHHTFVGGGFDLLTWDLVCVTYAFMIGGAGLKMLKD
jgi:hypothetical protein